MSMQKIFYMCIWYFVALCKFFVLVWHNILPFNKVGIYFKMKAENFLFFSPRVYKKFRLQKEVKQNCTSVRLFTKDMVRIHASFLKPLDGKPVVIFFHGQSENITKWQDTFLFLKKSGYGGLFLSYRGHFKSAGRPSEEGIYIDAETAVEYLKNIGFEEKNIILWGRSLGSAPALETALKYNVKSVILESPVYNITQAALSIFSRYIRLFNIRILKHLIILLIKNADFIQKFENDKKIQNVKVPILIMHAKNDEKINFEQAVGLHENNPSSKLVLVENGSHDYADWCYPIIEEFFAETEKQLCS